MDTVDNLLAAHPFLAGMSPSEVSRLAEHASPATFPAGTRIFDEGHDAARFWLIAAGHIRIDTVVPGRGLIIVETLGPGTVLGWSWMFPPHRWHFGAQAVDTTTAVELDGAAVRDLCDEMPALGYKLMNGFLRVVVDRLQNTRIRLLDLYGEST
jgi:CRP-like cAMP-binding protein